MITGGPLPSGIPVGTTVLTGGPASAAAEAGTRDVGRWQVGPVVQTGRACGASRVRERGERRCWAGRAEGGGARWAAWRETGRDVGRGEKERWASGLGCQLGLGLGFFLFSKSFPLFFFLFQTKLILFEFKFEFEFKPHSIK